MNGRFCADVTYIWFEESGHASMLFWRLNESDFALQEFELLDTVHKTLAISQSHY